MRTIWSKIVFFSLFLCLINLPNNLYGACQLQEIDLNSDGNKEIVMENDFLKMVLIPSNGGRCSSLAMKNWKEPELVGWAPPKHVWGGLFEDHFWQQTYPGDYTDRHFQYEVIEKGPSRVSVRLWARGVSDTYKRVEISKTITIEAGKSSILARYRITNLCLPDGQDRPLKVGFWAHQVSRPSIGEFAESGAYFIPTLKGIRSIPFDANTKGSTKEYEPSRGWIAMVGKSGHGIACRMDYRYLKGFELYPDSRFPSMEWRYHLVELKPGKSFKTKIEIIPFEGLTSVDGIGSDIAGSIELDKEKYSRGEKIHSVLSLYPAKSGQVRGVGRFGSVSGKNVKVFYNKELVLKAGELVKLSSSVPCAEEGTSVITWSLEDKGKIIAEIIKPVVIGNKEIFFSMQPECEQVESEVELADLVPDWARPVTSTIETPHIKWANPFAGKRLKVLFIATPQAERDIIELSQRFQFDYTLMPIMGDYYNLTLKGLNEERVPLLNEMLNGEYDVIVSVGLNLDDLSIEIQKKLIEKVQNGMGLISISSSNSGGEVAKILPETMLVDDKSWRKFGKWKKEISHFVSDGIPFKFLPDTNSRTYEKHNGKTILSCGKKPLLSISEYGKGRVACLCYLDRLTRRSLVPPVADHYAVNFDYWEYYFSFLAKLLLWVSNEEPMVEIRDLMPEGKDIRMNDKGDFDEIIEFSLLSSAKKRIKIEVKLRDKYGRLEKEYVEEKTLKPEKNQKLIFDIPKGIESGLHLADVVVKDERGFVLNWGTAYFTARRDIELVKITTDKDCYSRGEPVRISLTVNNEGNSPMKISIKANLSDSFSREILKQSENFILKEGKNNLEINFVPKDYLTTLHNLCLEISENKKVVTSSMTPIYLLREREEALKDYMPEIAHSHYYPPYLQKYMAQLLRKIGIRRAVISICGGDSNLRQLLENNLWIHYENLAWLGTRDPMPVEEGGYTRHNRCLSNPDVIKMYEDQARGETVRLKKFNILGHALGEENALAPFSGQMRDAELCFSDFCIKRFRDWLKESYGSIESLNEEWDTSYQAWEEISPIIWEKRDKTNPSQWVDFRIFMEDVFIGEIKSLREIIMDIDHNAYVGINASGGINTPFHGFDYAKLYKYDDSSMMYQETFKLELKRSLTPRYPYPLSVCTGYFYPDSRIKTATWHWALHGAQGVSYWGLASDNRFGYYWHIHPNLCFNKRSLLVKDACKDLMEGIGKIILNYPRHKEDEIAILYWRPSLHRSYAEDGVKYGPSYNAYLSSHEVIMKHIEDNLLQYKFVVEDQILDDVLRNYKVLILPYLVAPSDRILQKVNEFVNAGGVLVANMRLGFSDEHGKPVDRNSFLKETFGIMRKNGDYNLDLLTIKGVNNFKGINIKGKKLRVIGKENVTAVDASIIATYEDGKPAITVKKHGKGIAVYLSFVPRGDGSNRILLKKILSVAGILPEVKIGKEVIKEGRTYKTKAPGYEVFRFKQDNIECFGILRKKGGNAESINISFPYQAHIYDMRKKNYLGFRKEITYETSSPSYSFFGLLPYKVNAIDLKTEKSVYRQGDLVQFTAKVAADIDNIGDHVFRIIVYGPDGKECEAYTKNVISKDGVYSGEIPLAINDKVGTWKIKVMDVTSGLYDERNFELEL